MARKIDDNRLLEMTKEGKTGKECAEYFNVSGAAICKRLKRLSPPPLPASLSQLTEKEQRFCIEIAQGNNQTQSALRSFECGSLDSAKSLGYKLMQKPEIELAISELLTEAGLTKRYRMQKLKQHVDHTSADISLKALDQSWKLDGSYAPDRLIVAGISADLTPTDREMMRLLEDLISSQDDEEQARLRREIAELKNKERGIAGNVIESTAEVVEDSEKKD